jgi:hypothetical protein
MDEQRGFTILRIRRGETAQFQAQLLQQSGGAALFADVKANAIGTVGSFRKRTQIQADHRFLQPAPCGGNNFIGVNA